jgi:YgiT-type zinc finger domain-containing protein
MNYIEGQDCPGCKLGNIRAIRIMETFEYKGYNLDIPNYEVFHCDYCNEEYITDDFNHKITPLIKQFQKIVDEMTETFRDRLYAIDKGSYKKLFDAFHIKDECEKCINRGTYIPVPPLPCYIQTCIVAALSTQLRNHIYSCLKAKC